MKNYSKLSGLEMEVGISTVLLYEDIQDSNIYTDISPILRKLKEIGYRFVEINAWSLPHPSLTKKEKIIKMAKLATSLGLEVTSIHLGCNNPGDIGSLDRKLRQEAIEWIEKSIDLCGVFNPRYVGIHCGSTKQYTMESAQRLAKFARGREMKLALENGGDFKPKTLIEMIGSSKDRNLGILIDVGHCWEAGENPSEAIKEAGEHLFGLHIHDNNGKEDEHLIPGEGTINWEEMIKVLRNNIGYEGVFMMECMFSRITVDKVRIAVRARRAAEELLARYQ